MKIKKKCVAMLLAGGQGSRLYALTQKVAKPAIPYGGKNRFIDFPLSNCINSGIDTVGVLTQYQPMVLNEYIGNGSLSAMTRNMSSSWAVTTSTRWTIPRCWIITLPTRLTAPSP